MVETILSDEDETKLQLLLEILWMEEFYSGSATATLVGFGKKGPFQHLTVDHVFYYIDRFGLCLHHHVHGKRLKEEPDPRVFEKIYTMSCDEISAEWSRFGSWQKFMEALLNPKTVMW